MKLTEIRILPPIAIGRLGASAQPLDAYELKVSDLDPLDFRTIVPKESLGVKAETGEVVSYLPGFIQFIEKTSISSKDGAVRPVAPFLEVFAIVDDTPGQLIPLTTEVLQQAGFSLSDIRWEICVGTSKIYRRTGDENDNIIGEVSDIRDHVPHDIQGRCGNFLDGKTLPFGSFQFIKPNDQFPQLRARFTPAKGLVYGAGLYRKTSPDQEERDPVIKDYDQVLYDPKKGTWQGYKESTVTFNPYATNPADVFAGYPDNDNNQVSWGYLDDECAGFVEVSIGEPAGGLRSRDHLGAGPPAYAPDTLPIRVISDELEQILYGPEVDGEVNIEEAEDIVRRALETVRLMNTAVLNGNSFEGKWNLASSMVRQDTNDFNRYYEPVMAPELMDNLAILTLHKRVFAGLATGAAPWFSDVFRRPDEIGDLSNKGRRKMPALMRGADGRMLTLTHRQINMVIKAACDALFSNEAIKPSAKPGRPIVASDYSAQLHYQALGNPYSVLPRTAISNCFPGLEFDLKNLWRRAFQGIVLLECNNLVVEADEKYGELLGHRLVGINGKPTMVPTTGPVFPDGDPVPLSSAANPNGVSFMEWSNSLAAILHQPGEKVKCYFTLEKCPNEIIVTADDLKDATKFKTELLTASYIFKPGTAELSDDLVKPGELIQGLCSPWQNDYRECACYYWAASRPDYVNVEPLPDGTSAGDNWMAKKRSGQYIPDDRKDKRLVSYDDLFKNWQGELNFIIRGRDALSSAGHEKIQPPEGGSS